MLQEDDESYRHQSDIEEQIITKDHELLLSKRQGRADISVVGEVKRAIGWPQLWDHTLDNGKCI